MIDEQWKIELKRKMEKQVENLPEHVRSKLFSLLREIESNGVIQPNWPNYSPLRNKKGVPENSFHCHLKKGKPTYVACWRIIDKKRKVVEVFYVGTHENAPY